jgi:ribose 5-phosphate isomerase B
MKVAVGSDHAGFELKAAILEVVAREGHAALDLGTHSSAPVDYPDIALAVGESIQAGGAERGVLVCGSGVGVSIAANKLRGIRAAICHDHYSAHQGVEHDDMNVLVLGARVIGAALAAELVAAFLQAHFSADERHARRLNKVLQLEQRLSQRNAQ